MCLAGVPGGKHIPESHSRPDQTMSQAACRASSTDVRAWETTLYAAARTWASQHGEHAVRNSCRLRGVGAATCFSKILPTRMLTCSQSSSGATFACALPAVVGILCDLATFNSNTGWVAEDSRLTAWSTFNFPTPTAAGLLSPGACTRLDAFSGGAAFAQAYDRAAKRYRVPKVGFFDCKTAHAVRSQ